VFLTLLVMVTYQDTSCSYNGETRIENHLEGQDTITSFSGIFIVFLNFNLPLLFMFLVICMQSTMVVVIYRCRTRKFI